MTCCHGLLKNGRPSSRPESADIQQLRTLTPQMFVERFKGLDALFEPASIAVVGASDDATKFGGRVLSYLLAREQGPALRPLSVYAVNPRRSQVLGLNTHPSIKAIGTPIDLAVLSVPAEAVPSAIDDCIAAGVGAAIVFSAGFAETGEQGRLAQQALLDRANAAGLRLLGPNCIGLVNEHAKIAASFATLWSSGFASSGPVAVLSQSGATASYLHVMLQAQGIGVSLWASTGNEIDVDVADCIAYAARHTPTRIILAALEGLRDGARLMQAISDARAAGKIVVVMKVGRSALGGEAARSHTGALTGEDRVFDVALRRCGALRAHSFEDFIDLAAVFSINKRPLGRRIAVVSASGGAGILLADRAEDLALEMPELSPALRSQIDDRVQHGNSRNPVDVTAAVLSDFSLMVDPLVAVARSGEVDAVIGFLTSAFRSDESVTRVIAALQTAQLHTLDIPVLLSLTTSQPNLARLQKAGFAAFIDPIRAINALAPSLPESAHNIDLKSALSTTPTSLITADSPTQPPRDTDEASLLLWLDSHGIRAAPTERADRQERAVDAASRIGFPVALKLSVAGLAHKSDSGGVMLKLQDPEAVRAAYRQLICISQTLGLDDSSGGVIVQAMRTGLVETLLGYRYDPQFGPVVAFGLGGLWVEMMNDIALQIAPFDEATALTMIHSIKARGILLGARGRPRVDIDALARTLAAFSRLVARLPANLSLEINPFLIGPEGQGGWAVDAKLSDSRQSHHAESH
jgi:acyl-CoA synthetase (NDP forming)